MDGSGAPARSARPGASLAPRRPWSGRRVLLGVTGGIAAYKSIQLARDLAQLGAEVDVVLTHSAKAFVGPLSFEGLTGRPVLSSLVAEGHALDHIRLARAADVVCIAPATADFIARAAHGRADDLITAVLLATRAPVLVCPAMNDRMWAHPQTQANAAHLEELGYTLVGPAVGPLAWDEGSGPGRMVEPAVILEHVGRALSPAGPLHGKHIVVSAGPTREPVDAVRVLTNRSSGRMGYAIAAAAWRRGARVTLITGPTELDPPVGAKVVRAETAAEMEQAVRAALPDADALVMAAAIADFRPAAPHAGKLKKEQAPDAIALEGAPDVLRSTRDARPSHLVAVGFALESSDGVANARGKLERKGLDLIVLNPAGEEGAGFETETNRVTLITSEREEALPLQSKAEVAETILDRVAELMGRGR
ncbi:MAG TPA: bifunctional phosphopantothenoylcysteine decarboxylase/phosphopantothenate--cysteine ligase CoaBC [Longimicrobiales bacterium]|nr:bifunctional phosphopantothenoylcysteine decarboxylase/phosphopantothenate--cysteine ligase CoaBC [Longimicrobiales bacterium]